MEATDLEANPRAAVERQQLRNEEINVDTIGPLGTDMWLDTYCTAPPNVEEADLGKWWVGRRQKGNDTPRCPCIAKRTQL
jgi:hypothetical protein